MRCELEQRERVAGGGGVQAVDRGLAHECGGRSSVEPAQMKRRDVRSIDERRLPVAEGEDDGDRIGDQPAHREQHRIGARSVEPVGVVDQRSDRRTLGMRREQAERCRAHGEPILCGRRPEGEGAFERRPLRLGNPVEGGQRRA